MKNMLNSLIIILLSVLLMSVHAVAADVTSYVTVDENNIIKPSDKRLLGFNNDSTWHYNAAVAKGNSQMNPGYYQSLKDNQLEIPLLRGFFHNIYWKETIGEVSERGYDRFALPYAFGMVEWIKATMAVTPDVEFVITVNINDSVINIKDMVRFLTLEIDDPMAVDDFGVNWAERRMELGLISPVKIACFELGNETDMQFYGSAQSVLAGAQQYVSLCSPLIDGIKSVNETAKVSILSYTMPHDNTGNWSVWNGEVITSLGEASDYVVHHYYYHSVGNLGHTMDIQRFNNQIKSFMSQIPQAERPKIYLSEHAIWLDTSEAVTDKKIYVTALRGTLTTAEAINRLSNRSDVELATYHSFFGARSTPENFGGHCWGVLRPYYDGSLIMSGVGEYFRLAYAAFGENNVMVTCSGAHGFCTDATSGAGNQILTASAHTTNEGGLNLILVNQNPTVGHNIVFSSNEMYKLEEAAVLTDDNIFAENMPDNPHALTAKTILVNDDSVFTGYYIPPQSVVVLWLAPLEKNFVDSPASISLNGIKAENDIPEIVCFDGKLEVNCTFYDNKGMSDLDTVNLMILKPDANPSDIKAEDIVYLNQKTIQRQRIHFELTMPLKAEGGRYIAYISNRIGGSNNFRAVAFDYLPVHTNQSFIDYANISQSDDSDYQITAQLQFNDKAITEKPFLIKAVHAQTSEIAYIGNGVKDGQSQTFAFQMPKEAMSGTYNLTVGFTDVGHDVFTCAFEFIKPSEKVRILSLPIDGSGNEFLTEILTAGGEFNVSVQNISDNTVLGSVFMAVYDKYGTLITTHQGNTVSLLPNQIEDYSVAFTALQSEIIPLTVKAFIWADGSIMPLTDYYIVKR